MEPITLLEELLRLSAEAHARWVRVSDPFAVRVDDDPQGGVLVALQARPPRLHLDQR